MCSPTHCLPTQWESWCIRASAPEAPIYFVCSNTPDCTTESIEVFNSSLHYEVINGIEWMLSSALLFLPCCRTKRFFFRKAWDLLVINVWFLCPFHFRLPSMHAALQRTWWWSIASRRERPSSSVHVATASSRTQSSSHFPRGLHCSVCFWPCCFLLLAPMLPFSLSDLCYL